MTISELVTDGDSKNCMKTSFPAIRTWCWLFYGNIKSPELLKPRPLAVPHYGVKWAALSYLLPVSLGLMSGEAPTAWLLDQALLLLFPRPGQGLFLPSSPSSVSTLSLHTACEFAVIFWTIWVSWKPYFHHPFHWSCGKMPFCLTTLRRLQRTSIKNCQMSYLSQGEESS